MGLLKRKIIAINKTIIYEKSILLHSYIFSFLTSFSQEKFTISGYVTDANTGENIIGVTYFVKEIWV